MQTLSPTISPTISRTYNPRGTDAETDFLPAIAQSSVLQTALAGLDASLNDELDRYRHWQDNGQTISYLNPFRPRAVSTQSIWTSPSLSDALSPIAPITDSTTSDRRTIQMPVMPPMGAGLPANSSINISAAELHNFKGLESLQSLESFSGRGFEQDSPYAQDMNGYGESSSMASPTMARVPEPDDDEILQSFANDYADSYQQPIEQESAYPIPSAPNEKSAFRSLMNPVGIISLLLLLCSSAAIGYLMVDPSGVMKLFKPESKQKSSQNDVKNSDLGSDINLQNQQQKSNDAGLSFVPFAGDKNTLTNSNKSLSNPAIAPKNPLNNPSSKSSSLFAPNSAFVPSTPLRTVPSTALPPISVAPLPPALAPAERTYSPPSRNYDSAPAPSYNPPAPRPSTSRANSSPSPARSTPPNSTSPTDNPAPTTVYVTPRSNTAVKYAAPLSSAPAAPAPSSSYRVVVENSYAASAQQVERDAYVRPSDGQVQVGSYRDANAAQQRIEQLRRQGIPARIE
ncbi:hypothetical protein PseudUWO311_15775 [Pseudanabaena sp. UWO311]|uniref:SPOR domain-containing protein n=1 Tax=Pseudanabaena sp. UWO311 TaxID=2487337 RepID=UPI00115B209E|nr:hypothetical protein [Pseudanabaena sp. UWO311]TYQ25269.1 hypothetical protein PseudUWO311_15775 [Pseudanabaena sp. UWO311]